jgi:pilus assembly protein Flp/PilA
MLRHRGKISNSLKRLRADNDGVISFEYVAVAASIVTTVVAVFTATGSTSLSGALTSMLDKIRAAIT